MGLINYTELASLRLQQINVCDLGSGIPKESFDLINNVRNAKVSLVDNKSIPEVDSVNFGNFLTSSELETENPKSKYLSIKSNDFLYNEYLIHSLSNNQEYISLSEFNMTIEKNYEIDVVNYLEKQSKEVFDVVIISKLLANVSNDKKTAIMNRVPEIMKPNSLLFVRLNYLGYDNMDLVKPVKLIFETLKTIEEREEVISSTRQNKLITLKKYSM